MGDVKIISADEVDASLLSDTPKPQNRVLAVRKAKKKKKTASRKEFDVTIIPATK